MSSRHRECISALASFAEVIFILVLELPVCPSWKPSTLGDQFPYIIIRPCIQLRGGGFPFIHVTNPLEAKQKNQRKNRIRSSVLEEVDARTKDPITNQDRKMLEAIKTLGDSECAVTVSKFRNHLSTHIGLEECVVQVCDIAALALRAGTSRRRARPDKGP